MKFPSGEARALQVRASFRDDHFNSVAAFDGHANNSKSSANSSSGERAGVALSHHAAGFRKKFGTEASDIFVALAAFFMVFQGFIHEGYADIVQPSRAVFRSLQREFLEAQLKTLDGPE